MTNLTKAYTQWLKQLKERVRSAQIKASLKVNAELLSLYWDLGKEIQEKEKETKWGGRLIEQLSKDLLAEFPDMKGFSVTNLYYIKRWFLFYNDPDKVKRQRGSEILPQVVAEIPGTEKLPQPVAKSSAGKEKPSTANPIAPPLIEQIPWGHHREIITKCKDINEALFYIAQTMQHNWSRSVLVHQIESGLYKRKGKALTNFEYTLPKPQGDLASELLKNPYQFDFLQLGEEATERDLETALTDQLVKFLLELGAGFAYIGRQQLLVVDEEDFFLDLLFYHTRLHCYVIVELKMDNFKPEYAGKLNFYLAAVDARLKSDADQPSIGLLLCKKAGKLIVEYSLKNIRTPIGVSEYKLTETVPSKLKGKLPDIKQIEAELKHITR
jgi:predicted nuclease of restriction endonuclease-like (RecB) superfamily